MEMNTQIIEIVALLREAGPWSDEFQSIRTPLSNLLERLSKETLARSLVSKELNALLDALGGMEWSSYEPLETWIINAEKELANFGIHDGKKRAIEVGLVRLMRAL